MAGYPLVKVRTLAKFAVLSSALLAAALLLAATIRTLTLDVSAGLHIAKWEKIVYVPSDISGPQREHLLANLKAAIQIPTVSFSDYEQNVTALEEFGRLLRRAFPTVFSSSRVRYEVVSNYSHLFWVPGSDPSLEPYMLLAHIDVVPAFEADGWDAPPFSGREVDGFIYGRGTIDNKQSVMGILQALEFLLERGYAPRRGFYIGLGHDEEINGHFGAANIVKLLQSRGVSLAFVLDEGSAILDGVIHGLESPVAMIAVTEKGMASVKLSVTTLPGHSSMPPAETSIGILASAVTRLEKNPLPLLFGHGPERDMFEHLAHKINVMPPYAEAFVNLRIHPAQTVEEVLELIRLTVNDERVKIELDRGFDPLPVSSFDDKSFGYQIVKKTLLDMFPQISVAPGVCVGNTDSRHYNSLTKDIYRFTPTWFKPGDEKRFHGVNERISMRNYEEIVHFYFQLFQNCDTRKLPESHSAQHDL
ncbi:hypothetical protein Z043_114611 [Scleropages formosus]|uniref:Peptidase M20 dimerisation domain-containing protein n=1 Tax=Scleropages formosus TaxID=113540 RepID=A0A0P7WYC1_SCLFO|nr:hypothetical protein Z043_114611 [Scleropages formosus]